MPRSTFRDHLRAFRLDAARWVRPQEVADVSEVTIELALKLLVRHLPLRAMAWFRFGAACRDAGVRGVAGRVQRRLLRVYGLELAPGTPCGGGLYIAHPVGCVLHAASIGENVTVVGSVTFGTRTDARWPVIEDGVFVGVGARVLGGITVGQRAEIGANAVVIHDVAPGDTVVGIPARVVRSRDTRPDGTLPTMQIGLGCVNLGSASAGGSPSDHVRLVRSAIDSGITVLDTADAYGSGASERIVGRAVAGRREAVTISTKGGYVFRERSAGEQRARRLAGAVLSRVPTRSGAGPPAPSGNATASAHQNYVSQSFTPTHLRAALDASLHRLGTDHVDVYQLHGPPHLLDDLLAALDDLRTAGKVLRFGVGAESIGSAADWATVPEVEVLQLPFGLLDPEAATVAFPLASQHHVACWARGVLGGGILSMAMADRSAVADHPKAELVWRILDLADEADIGPDELAVRWVVGHPGVSVTLLGTSSQSHLRRNLHIAGLPPLPPDVRARLDALVTAPRGDS
jgi:serine O-acetyltransferase